MYTIDDCSDYAAYTAATFKGVTTCCDAPIKYRDNDHAVEVCTVCDSIVVVTVPF